MAEKLLTEQELSEAVKPIDPPSKAKSDSTGTTRRKRTANTSAKKTSSASKVTIAELKDGLAGTFTLMGLGIGTLDSFDGQVITENAEDMADALIDIAKTNPTVMRWLESMITVSAYGGLITVFGMQVAMPMAVHHNMLPEPLNSFMAEQGDIPIKAKPENENPNLQVVPNGNPNSD